MNLIFEKYLKIKLNVLFFIDLYILSFFTIGLHMIFLIIDLGKISPKKHFKKAFKIKLMAIFFIDYINYIIFYHFECYLIFLMLDLGKKTPKKHESYF